MRPHGDLPLKAPVAYRTVVRQCFRVCGKVFGKVILPEEPLLTDPALVRLNARVPHLVPPHVGAVRELHVTHVALEQLPVDPVRRRVVVFHLHFGFLGGIVYFTNVSFEGGFADRFEVATVATEAAVAGGIVVGVAARHPFDVVLFGFLVLGC